MHGLPICTAIVKNLDQIRLKGTAPLMITLFYMKDLNKPWILIPVSSNRSKYVEVVGV